MSRRFLTIACALLAASNVSVARSAQDSLRVDRDSVETRSPALVFLSDEEETWPDHVMNDGRVETSFSLLWRLPETLEEVTGGLSPASARLTGLPLMRGLNAKRTAVTFDGVPLDHSGLREGPSLVPLGVIDPALIGGLRVLRGPLASEGSSDGMAGAIDIRSSLRDAAASGTSGDGTSLLLSQRISSADRGWSGGAAVGGDGRRLRYRLGASGRLLGDVRAGSGAGNGPSLQPNTSLSESTLQGLLSYEVSDRWSLRAGGMSSWRRGQAIVEDLDALRIELPSDSITVFDPRRFSFAYVSSRLNDVGIVGRLESTLWYNGSRESRTFRRAEWGRTVFDDDRLSATGIRTMAMLNGLGDHTVTLAVDAKVESADARRWEVRDDESVWGQRGRFPVGTRSRVLAIGIADAWQISRDVVVTADMRLQSRKNHSAYGPSVFGLSGLVGLVDRAYTGISWRAGIERTWSAGWALSASAASGFRAPGLDEQVANAFWLHGRDVPNPELRPERAMQLELAGKYEGEQFSAATSLFRTSYAGLIGRGWFEPGPDGLAGSQDDLYRFVNHGSTTVYGLETELSARFVTSSGMSIALVGRIGTHAWSSEDAATPRYLPPVVGRVGSRVAQGRAWVEPYVRFSSRTTVPLYSAAGSVSDDTPGWVTANVRAGVRASGRLLVGVGVENATDVRYREHGSYLESPGRNLVVSLSYRI